MAEKKGKSNSVSGKKAAVRPAGKRTVSTKKKDIAVRAQTETAKIEQLRMDLSWVALLALAAFFFGFYVSTYFVIGEAPVQDNRTQLNQTMDENTLGICPVTGEEGKAGAEAVPAGEATATQIP